MRIPKGGIAFFDSGIGGLTVLAECIKMLPDEVFYYYGDNAHAPYGNLSERKIKRYVFRAFKKFKKLQVSAVVLACNTATAICIENLRKKYSFPIIGAEPAVGVAAKGGGEIFVLTTRATYESARFQNLCRKIRERYPEARLRPHACDDLAGAIEKDEVTFENISQYLPKGNPTSVVLGCTHYIYVKEEIEKFYDCKAYNGNFGIANRLRDALEKKRGEKLGKIPSKNDFFEKNWDWQPPFTKKAKKMSFSTTFRVAKEKKIKANKRSQKYGNQMQKRGGINVFSIGNHAKTNMRSLFELLKK